MTSAPVSYSTLGAIGTAFPVVEYFAEPPVDSFEAGNILTVVRAAFGMDSEEFTKVLHVTQKTIYSWTRQESDPSATDSVRLRRLKRLADMWDAQCNLSARISLHVPFGETTLLAALCAENLSDIDWERIIADAVKFVRNNYAERKAKIPHVDGPPVQGSEYDFITLKAFMPDGILHP